MIIFISMISFFLDGIISKYVSFNSLFLPLFTLVSIILIYPYFNNNNFRYFRYIAILGLLYDIVYMNLLFYNFFVFMILGFINIFISYLLSHRLYINLFITVISIILYRLINYIYMLIIGDNCSFILFFKSVYSSLILNIIYCIIIYLITEGYSKKHKILKSK